MLFDREELPEEFLSQVTHEFRGSLNTILGWAEFLRSLPGDDPARVRAAETIVRHARQQSWMIGELIDTWRLASGSLHFNLSPVHVGDLARAAMDDVESMARAKQVQLELRQEAEATARTRGDAKRLTQALTAVLFNAVHFAPAGTVVQIHVTSDPRSIELTVHDSGTGVDRAALPFLFERARPPEAAAGSPRRDFRLGLSLVRDVLTFLGGSITAESDGEASGVTFRICLPIVERTDDPPHVSALRPGLVDDHPGLSLRGVRVLIVDDEADAREALAGILRHYGATVHPTASVADAMEALQSERVDVLLADIGMPGADGYDLIRSVRKLTSPVVSHVPAGAVTAFVSDADRRRALDAGYQVHLSKPVDPSVLVATVAELSRDATSVR